MSKQVKDELSHIRQRMQGVNSRASNKSAFGEAGGSPSRMVLIDMHQAKNIFNSGVTKTDAAQGGAILTPNEASRNGEENVTELASLRSRQYRLESADDVDEEDDEESPVKDDEHIEKSIDEVD